MKYPVMRRASMKAEFFSFMRDYGSLKEILTDHKLASLGDAYVNLIYSIALSKKKNEPTSTKVSSQILSQALKKAKLREFLPKRMDRHALADSAEALIVYAWIKNAISLEESVTALTFSDDVVKSFTSLLLLAKERLKL
ncbi:MAG: ribonuclease III family protein [Candidatus Bathyarchaeia archaeon]|nr:hypothetical protein [Candidatus Bathyarchaeota archaeon A05DMB-4]MDH7595281.1 ribonuclease III family protein [Candidatus Bathyarchaeota archaeon]